MTHSIRLVEATAHSVQAVLDKDHHALARITGARVPQSFPPDLLDDDALRWTLGAIAKPDHDPRWGMYWIVTTDSDPVLAGVAGFKGKPVDGCVELGYGVVAEQQRRGFATAAVRQLLERAFADPAVTQVAGETLPDLAPSIGVLVKCGFELIGNGSEPGVIRYLRGREAVDRTGGVGVAAG
jgi:ribosomal-protein-alanine N-acetyltransferase